MKKKKMSLALKTFIGFGLGITFEKNTRKKGKSMVP